MPRMCADSCSKSRANLRTVKWDGGAIARTIRVPPTSAHPRERCGAATMTTRSRRIREAGTPDARKPRARNRLRSDESYPLRFSSSKLCMAPLLLVATRRAATRRATAARGRRLLTTAGLTAAIAFAHVAVGRAARGCRVIAATGLLATAARSEGIRTTAARGRLLAATARRAIAITVARVTPRPLQR